MDRTDVTVESVTEVGSSTIAIELESPAGFEALPGQFVLLRATPDDEEITRYYTLSSPTVEETFEITVGIDPEGELAPWLAELEAGDAVSIEGPYGKVAYEGDQDVVAVAGGPGVGPAVAIAEAANAAGHDAAVIYQDDEPAHVDRLEALEAAGCTTTLIDDGDDESLEGAIETHLEGGQFYVFGFEDFVTQVADAIEAAGGDADEALIENFG
ncbi:FAD-dependent oxidoreductase [Halobacteria archaeon AArc-curdl1]|uniref:FAD-dependent oxidoreductase n=1 Tax=Natronosalvus hydrolyticus TaxID=2979988 RepID=A0AAP2Z9Q4_9EURY|nr:FAD-dependent oxidoreductase [Halobacteria archaeon AArc-curdl1]